MFIIDWLSKGADHHPDKVALVDVETGKELSYLEFDTRASRFAEFLRDQWQIKKGDRVAVLAHNSSEYLEMLYGCAKIGAILVCLNWRLSVAELEAILADSEPSGLIFGKDLSEQGKALLQSALLRYGMILGETAADNVPEYEACLSQSSGRRIPMPNWGTDETWHLLYTSGTTGKPKGVLQTYGMVVINAVNSMLHGGINQQDTTLAVLPFFHTGGLNLFTNPVLFCGGTVYLMRQFDVDRAIELLNSKITTFLFVPAIYQFISQHPKFKDYQFKNIRMPAAGGAPIPHSLLQEYGKKGLTIRCGFGMTETGPTVFLTDDETSVKKVGSVGKPVRLVETRVVDSKGRDCKVKERGELLIRGPGVTPGYWRMPEATAKAIVDGWLYTGDIAYFDDDGDYYIVDRSKDMFISGGENVYPAEVENVLYQLAGIKEAAVIGVSDDKWGEVGKAIIALAPGTSLSVGDITQHCRNQLAAYKVPKHVVFVEALPRNASGKVEKPQLRKIYGN
ncbi:MAG: long-chain fatty acid--CoA ligase [Burkholderiales bacterium]|nr:long-chain fatty acid--CoA ligase [Burkholderiales bacterium]